MCLCSNRDVYVSIDREPDDCIYHNIRAVIDIISVERDHRISPILCDWFADSLIVVFTIIIAYVYHMTENWMLSAVLEVLGIVASVATYIVKSSLFENLLTKILGKLALADVFTDITNNHIVDITGIVLYLSVIAIFIVLTIQAIQKRRWS